MSYHQLGAKYARVNEGRLSHTPTARDYKGKSGRVSFDRDALISYSTVVARYHAARSAIHLAPTVVWLIDAEWHHGGSISTASQIRKVSRSVTAQTFVVPHIGEHHPACVPLDGDEHTANVMHYVNQAYAHAANAERLYLRASRVSWELHYLQNALANACRYASAFGIERMVDDLIPTASTWVFAIRLKVDEKLAKFNHPKAVAKRERAHARRIAKIALGLSNPNERS